MEPGSRRPAQAGVPAGAAQAADCLTARPVLSVGPVVVRVIVADHAWRRIVPRVEALCARAARAGGGAGSVVLTSDRAVKQLNARHRGKNKPTNVLTFESPLPEQNWGDILLARGTVLREARVAGRPVAHHLAHLVVHGALHLRGFLHDAPGEARRMERMETRLLHRLGIPNPWRSP